MASNTATTAPRLRRGRPLIAAVAVEIVLIAITIALFASMPDPNPVLDMVIPPLALLLFIPAGYWTANGTTAPVLNGFVAGLWGIVLYVALTLIANGAVADFDLESSVRPAYLLAHGLKVVGGVIGGWLVARKLAD
ncbi:hypothetical protein GCM10009127_14140 [Alteraurantiacibacter aestuarii]|uniref:Uncharacterized protein n=1 Tax=Alteraurantiacibacter aestuarii TaxID=650004 RepID=A0A844ZMD0_9SPHN|nr:hypothetical protein [Alteraurantiacibacter aestuarii]MXO87997.1 hypothetical protein [Alteraurantiacibacter aestuarii]